MKKFIETLKEIYSGAWCKWLFVSVASMTVLPFFIKTAALFIKKEALGVGWLLLANSCSCFSTVLLKADGSKQGESHECGDFVNGVAELLHIFCLFLLKDEKVIDN